MIIHNTSIACLHYGKFAHGRKSYHAGRWYVRDGAWRFSAPAYVSPNRPNTEARRVSARGKMVTHS